MGMPISGEVLEMANPTPHWRRIERHHAEAHAALRHVAQVVCEQAEEPVSLDANEGV